MPNNTTAMLCFLDELIEQEKTRGNTGEMLSQIRNVVFVEGQRQMAEMKEIVTIEKKRTEKATDDCS